MILIKTKEEIAVMREGGKRLAQVLQKVSKKVMPGISTMELEDYARKLIAERGDTPAFLNYKPEGSRKAYPAALCVSVNDEVVHGIPGEYKILKEGDIVSLDCGIKHKGLFTDSAITVPVGVIDSRLKKLLEITEKALYVGVEAAKAGNTVGDIGNAIEKFVKPHKFGIVRILSGHGVGRAIHEEPYVPNFGKKGNGVTLKPGMTIAIEPMFNLGRDEVFLDADQFTYKTADGQPSVHFEHTIAITESGPEILTKI